MRDTPQVSPKEISFEKSMDLGDSTTSVFLTFFKSSNHFQHTMGHDAYVPSYNSRGPSKPRAPILVEDLK